MSPVTIHQAIALAIQHHQAGRLVEAEAIYREVLAQQPHHSDALHLLGLLMGQLGRPELAVDLIRRAIASSSQPAYWSNLGKILADQNRIDEAIAAYEQALQLNAHLPEAHNNLGNLLKSRGKVADAQAHYRLAIRSRPEYVEAHYNLGNLLADSGRFDEAIECLQHALRLRPSYAQALSSLGNALTFKGRYEEAVAACKQAIALKPDFTEAFGNLGNALRELRDYESAIAAYRQALALSPRDATGHSNLLLALNYHPAATSAQFLHEARQWDQAHAAPLAVSILSHQNNRDPDRKLRIGYLSPDFRNHPVASFIESVLKHHDPQHFDVIGYSDTRIPDQVTHRLQGYAALWRDTAPLSDLQLADLIRADGVDILIDLAMHSAYNRLPVFARKPAPIQVTWLAYPGTTGLSAVDYRFSDPFLDPEGTDLSRYAEKTVRLETFWCYHPPVEAQEPGPPPCERTGFITFGSLNNFCKASDQALDTWARLLVQIPNSRLLLHARSDGQRAQVAEKFRHAGVAPERCEFAGRLPRADYYSLYHRIDIGLDPFPCAGGTTTCDALWMGVPVVTLAGQTPIARGGVSILSAMGLPELIAQSTEEYIEKCAALASELDRLKDMRRNQRSKMRASLLMDAPRFSNVMERAFRQMWQKWCAMHGG